MSMTPAPTFVLEEHADPELRKYHKIHVEGCRHVVDPNPIGRAADRGMILAGLKRMTEEFETEQDVRSAAAPCVHKALKAYRRTAQEEDAL